MLQLQLGQWVGSPGAQHGGAVGPWRPGLSIPHISPQEIKPPAFGLFLITSFRGGNVATCREIGRPRPMPLGRVRGVIKGFSRSSRLNMLETVHQVDRAAVLERFFATYTVPRGEADWRQIECFRDAYFKRFERKWSGQAFVIWKKELHKSGTVHLHGLIFWVKTPPKVSDFREWNDAAWSGVVKSSNRWHKSVGCRVERMNSWNGVGHYCAKYLAKDQDGLREQTGRIWGVYRRDLIPCGKSIQELPSAAGKRVRRVLRKLQVRRREKWWAFIEGRWLPLRAEAGFASVADQIKHCKNAGVRVKRSRPRCLVTRDVQVWGRVEDSGRVEPIHVERHSFAGSMHFILEHTCSRLLSWAMSRWVYDLEVEQDGSLPF